MSQPPIGVVVVPMNLLGQFQEVELVADAGQVQYLLFGRQHGVTGHPGLIRDTGNDADSQHGLSLNLDDFRCGNLICLFHILLFCFKLILFLCH